MKVGDQAPDFELSDEHGTVVRLSEYWAKAPVLLVFYPGDFTPVCTRQLCSYRDEWSSLESRGVEVLGINLDSVQKHQQFKERYRFPFRLLSDPDGSVVESYGMLARFPWRSSRRGIVVIDRSGRIVYRKVEALALTYRNAAALEEILRGLRDRGSL